MKDTFEKLTSANNDIRTLARAINKIETSSKFKKDKAITQYEDIAPGLIDRAIESLKSIQKPSKTDQE